MKRLKRIQDEGTHPLYRVFSYAPIGPRQSYFLKREKAARFKQNSFMTGVLWAWDTFWGKWVMVPEDRDGTT